MRMDPIGRHRQCLSDLLAGVKCHVAYSSEPRFQVRRLRACFQSKPNGRYSQDERIAIFPAETRGGSQSFMHTAHAA